MLLPLLARDRRVPPVFRQQCCELATNQTPPRWVEDLLTGFAENPVLSPAEVTALAACGRGSVLRALLLRPGLDADSAITLLGSCTNATVLCRAVRVIPDPAGVLAAHVLTRSQVTTLLHDVIRYATADGPRLDAAELLLTDDARGLPRPVYANLLTEITDLAARIPDARIRLRGRAANPSTGARTLLDLLTADDRAAAGAPVALPPAPTADDVTAWLLRDTVTAEQAVTVLKAAGHLTRAQQTKLWRQALRRVPDPTGALCAAAAEVGRSAILTVLAAAMHLPAGRRRAAVLQLATDRARVGQPRNRWAPPAQARPPGWDLIGAAPLAWRRALLEVTADPQMATALLSQPDSGTAEEIWAVHPRFTDTSGSVFHPVWAEFLVRASGVLPVGDWLVSPGFRRGGWDALTEEIAVRFAIRTAAAAVDPTAAGAALIGAAPVGQWRLLFGTAGQRFDLPAAWLAGALTEAVAALSDPVIGRTLFDLDRSGLLTTFAGTVTDLLDVAAGMSSPGSR
jgi:hypothetical protein